MAGRNGISSSVTSSHAVSSARGISGDEACSTASISSACPTDKLYVSFSSSIHANRARPECSTESTVSAESPCTTLGNSDTSSVTGVSAIAIRIVGKLISAALQPQPLQRNTPASPPSSAPPQFPPFALFHWFKWKHSYLSRLSARPAVSQSSVSWLIPIRMLSIAAYMWSVRNIHIWPMLVYTRPAPECAVWTNELQRLEV